MNCVDVRFSGHALMRMFERGLSPEDVLATIAEGEVIADYPDDQPHPSRLILGWRGGTPVHVVVARTPDAVCVIVTAYVPSNERWNDNFKTRRDR